MPDMDSRIITLYTCSLCHMEMWLPDDMLRKADRKHHMSLIDTGKQMFGRPSDIPECSWGSE